MLKTLRKRLATTCMLITATILATMSLISLSILEKQFTSQQYTLIENYLNTIVFRLQTDQSISHTFLSELEATNHLLIYIEDNDVPLLFRGNTPSMTPRSQLICISKNLAETKYHFTSSTLYTPTLEIPKVSFEFKTDEKEHYLAIVGGFSSEVGRFNLVILKDMKIADHYIFMLRFLFVMLTIIGFLLLGIFSFWFAGHAIKPIELSQRKQTEFIAAASHELRSPLSVIDTNTSALQYQPDSTDAHFINIIHKECSRMKRLIDDLLLLAHTDAHQWSIQTTPVEIDTLLLNVYELFVALSKQKDLMFNIVLPETAVPTLNIDQERIEQALTILIDNAFAYTPKGGKVSLVLRVKKEALCIDVIDNGPGISVQHQPHVFDRFYRVDTSRHDKTHYGLGLSIAYEIMHLHKGKLLLTDTPGGGCTFTLCFPLK